MSGMSKAGTGEKVEDSNLANYGSKEHKDLRKGAAETEEAWKGCGKSVGLEVWRIEKFKVVAWPKSKYGSFFSGDSYIILQTYKDAASGKTLYNIFFWLGKETSQDEAGTAAYKTVELDDLLGDLPVQYRECDGFESDEFKALWNGKLMTMAGGVDSGFNHVKPKEYKPRLLQMKSGKKKTNIHVSEVDCKLGSINTGDVFIMDNGLQIFQYNGPKSSLHERRKASEIIVAMKEDRHGKAKSEVLEKVSESETFYSALGETTPPDDSKLPLGPEDGKDPPAPEPSLHKVSDASGHLEMTQVGSAAHFKKSDLDANDVFILDLGKKLYVWVGGKASKVERAQAVKTATQYLKEKGANARQIQILRQTDGKECSAFNAYFK